MIALIAMVVILSVILYILFKPIVSTENFTSLCMDVIPYNAQIKYPVKSGCIFVSVASYRDPECSLTLESLFGNAKYPHNVYVGICEQNNDHVASELCIGENVLKYKNNILITKMDYKDAQGPTFARYYCSTLWRGEQYYLQIDSHMYFSKNWDEDLLEMFRHTKLESHRPVLSVYPPTEEQMSLDGFPEFDNGTINANGIPSFLCGWSKPCATPKRGNKCFAAAGFMFLESDFLFSVPFDPNLSHLFQLEELLYSARLWTNGWDFYVPNKKIVYHHYNRTKASLYHRDIKQSAECRTKAEKRGLFLLGLVPKQTVADEFLRNYNKYGLGKFRSVDDFWKACGIDIKNKTVERWNDSTPPSDKFKGWSFRLNGYERIAKYQPTGLLISPL